MKNLSAVKYDVLTWKFFIDSLPVAHSVHLKKTLELFAEISKLYLFYQVNNQDMFFMLVGTTRNKLEPGTKMYYRKIQSYLRFTSNGNLCKTLTILPNVTLKECIFVEPQTTSLMNEKEFQATMIVTELETWLVHTIVCNGKYTDYRNIIATLLDKYQEL